MISIASRVRNRPAKWILGLGLLGLVVSSVAATTAHASIGQAATKPRPQARGYSVAPASIGSPLPSIEMKLEAPVETPVEAVQMDHAAPIELPAARNAEEDFIYSLVPGARESQHVTGVPASVTLAQGILESSWGRSGLSARGHNYFGIKALTKEGPAGVIWMETWEVENGSNVMRHEPFRQYNNAAESLIDHGYFFVENGRYANAMAAANDPREFARRINRAGYATDPQYAPKLISLMDAYNLYQFDLA